MLLTLLGVVTLGLYGLLSFGYRVAAGKHAPPLSAAVSKLNATAILAVCNTLNASRRSCIMCDTPYVLR